MVIKIESFKYELKQISGSEEKMVSLVEKVEGVANTGSYPAGTSECSGDHTLFHATNSIEDVVDILEKGFKPNKNGTHRTRVWNKVPCTFFGGYPADNFGSIILVTHTNAIAQAGSVRYEDERMKHCEEGSGGQEGSGSRNGLAELHYDGHTELENERGNVRLLFEEANKEFQAGRKYRSFEERYKEFQKTEECKQLDRAREKLARIEKEVVENYRTQRRKGLIPSPCKYIEIMEEKIGRGEIIQSPDLERMAHVLWRMQAQTTEHVAIAPEDQYIKPSDGIGIGLVGGDSNLLAKELRRINIPFLPLPYNRFEHNQSGGSDTVVQNLLRRMPLAFSDFPVIR